MEAEPEPFGVAKIFVGVVGTGLTNIEGDGRDKSDVPDAFVAVEVKV